MSYRTRSEKKTSSVYLKNILIYQVIPECLSLFNTQHPDSFFIFGGQALAGYITDIKSDDWDISVNSVEDYNKLLERLEASIRETLLRDHDITPYSIRVDRTTLDNLPINKLLIKLKANSPILSLVDIKIDGRVDLTRKTIISGIPYQTFTDLADDIDETLNDRSENLAIIREETQRIHGRFNTKKYELINSAIMSLRDFLDVYTSKDYQFISHEIMERVRKTVNYPTQGLLTKIDVNAIISSIDHHVTDEDENEELIDPIDTYGEYLDRIDTIDDDFKNIRDDFQKKSVRVFSKYKKSKQRQLSVSTINDDPNNISETFLKEHVCPYCFRVYHPVPDHFPLTDTINIKCSSVYNRCRKK